MKEEECIKKLLQGEQMGINLYKKYIEKIPEGIEHNKLQQLILEHQEEKSKLENILQEKGMDSKVSVGLLERLTEFSQDISLLFNTKRERLIRKLYKGEIMGLSYCERYINEAGEELVPEFKNYIDKNKQRIEVLRGLVDRNEY